MVQEKKQYNRLKAVLADKGKINLWLAEQLKVNKTTVSKWYTNDVQPKIENLFRISKSLKIDMRVIELKQIK